MSKYYNLEVNEVYEKVSSSKEGISDDEAKSRLKKYGLNKLKESKKKSFIVKFLEQFKDVMLIILLISAVISGIVSVKTGETLTDSIIILFVVILNAVLGVIQESKAEKAIEALKSMSLPYIKARRNGKIESVKVEELVIGDVVLIEAGDYIPADLRIIESHSLKIEEAALTGESLSVDKQAEKIDKEEVALGDRVNMAYTGSSVVYGRGEGIWNRNALDRRSAS